MTTIQKEQVKPSWKPEQLHEMFSHMTANNFMVAMNVLGKHGEAAVNEFKTESRKPMIQYYKRLNVKTPIEILRAKAELETNVFGSVTEVWGNETEAHLTYIKCGMWDAMKKCSGGCAETEAKMMQGFESCVAEFAHEFGFKGEVKVEGEKATITIKK
jgi:hypothetical protein